MYIGIMSVTSRPKRFCPLYCVGCEFLFVCVGAWDFWGASYWIDTLVLKNWGKYLRYYCCITLSSSRKTNASSRRSKKDFWRRCRGGLRSSQDIPSTHHKPISLAFTLFAICLSFSSPPLHPCRFICPLFPNLEIIFLVFLIDRCKVKSKGKVKPKQVNKVI